MRLQQNSDASPGDTISVAMDGSPVRIHLEVSGPQDGPRLLVMHGWGASTALMRPLIASLSDTFRVAAFDFPGHGSSPVPPGGYGMPGHLEVLRGVIDHLGWTSFGIVGHSNGGRVALSWAAEAPSALRYLVLIAPSGVRRRRTMGYYVRFWTARILKAPFQLLPGRLKELGLDWLRHSLVWRLLGSSDYRSLDGVMRETFVQTVNHYVEDILGRVRVPVLLLRGANDDAISAEQIRTLERGLPDAGQMTIDDAGHYAHMDRPDIVAAAIRQMEAA